jgi:hypothetical protein
VPTDQVVSISASVLRQKTYVLSKSIAAIRLTSTDDNGGKLGVFVQLPLGSRLQQCGDGCNDHTVKVHCAREFYFVFWQDLYDAVQHHLQLF